MIRAIEGGWEARFLRRAKERKGDRANRNFHLGNSQDRAEQGERHRVPEMVRHARDLGQAVGGGRHSSQAGRIHGSARRQPPHSGYPCTVRFWGEASTADAGLGQDRGACRHPAQQGAAGRDGRRRRARRRGRADQGLPHPGRLL